MWKDGAFTLVVAEHAGRGGDRRPGWAPLHVAGLGLAGGAPALAAAVGGGGPGAGPRPRPGATPTRHAAVRVPTPRGPAASA